MSLAREWEPTMFDCPAKMKTRRVFVSDCDDADLADIAMSIIATIVWTNRRAVSISNWPLEVVGQCNTKLSWMGPLVLELEAVAAQHEGMFEWVGLSGTELRGERRVTGRRGLIICPVDANVMIRLSSGSVCKS